MILNGVKFDDDGKLVPLPEPYPGSNLFSLASGGAIFVRDPQQDHGRSAVERRQIRPLTDADWELILPYLEENQKLFGITVEQLLTVNGKQRKPAQVYRKVVPGSVKAIVSEETDDVGRKKP